jgi:hypothetical protein
MSTGHADLDILSVRWGRVGQPGQTLAAFLDAKRGLHQASLLSEEHVYAEAMGVQEVLLDSAGPHCQSTTHAAVTSGLEYAEQYLLRRATAVARVRLRKTAETRSVVSAIAKLEHLQTCMQGV